MIGTQIFRNRLPSNRSIEHPTQCLSIDDAGVNAESDNAASVLIHNDQYPVRPQRHRFASEQINAMKAIFRVTDKGEPGRSRAISRGMVVGSKNPPDHILIYTSAKGQIDLLGNARTSPSRIVLLHLDNGTNYGLIWTFWSRLRSTFWRKQESVFALNQSAMEIQQGRWLECDR